MLEVKTYDPAQINLFVGGFRLSGYAPGTFIQLALDVPRFSDDQGVDGEPIRWDNKNPFSRLNVSLSQTSVSNTVLSGLAVADRYTQAAIFPIYLEEGDVFSSPGSILSGGLKSNYISAQAWITGQAAIGYGPDPIARVWEFRLIHVYFVNPGVSSTPVLENTIT